MCADTDHDGYERQHDHSRVLRLVVLPRDQCNDWRGQNFEQLIGTNGVVLQREIGENHEGTERDRQRQHFADGHSFTHEGIQLQTYDETQRGEEHLYGRECHGFDFAFREQVLVQTDDSNRCEDIRCTTSDDTRMSVNELVGRQASIRWRIDLNLTTKATGSCLVHIGPSIPTVEALSSRLESIFPLPADMVKHGSVGDGGFWMNLIFTSNYIYKYEAGRKNESDSLARADEHEVQIRENNHAIRDERVGE